MHSFSANPMTVAAKESFETTQPSRSRGLRQFPPWCLGLLLPVSLAVFYELAVRLGWMTGRLLPPPSRILTTIWELAASGELWTHMGVTLLRVTTGFALGSLAGVFIGAASGVSPLLRRLADPLLQALRAIPSIAWVPLFILWFGIFETSKVVLIAVGVFFPIYLGVTGAILSVDRKIIEIGRIFRLSRLALIWRVLLPSVLPSIVIALRSGLGLGWMFVVAAEFMGASEGLGYLLIDGQQLGRPDQIMAALVIFASLGKATDALLVAVSRPFLTWQDVTLVQSNPLPTATAQAQEP
jgi:sulfonate transport system permease protein